MNNALLQVEKVSFEIEENIENNEYFIDREAKLLKVIEALKTIQETNEWRSLKEELLDKLPTDLERQISVEAKKENPNIQKLNRLTGELKWAERYSDLQKLENEFRVELKNIRLKLYGKTEKDFR